MGSTTVRRDSVAGTRELARSAWAWVALLGLAGCMFVEPVDLTPPDASPWIPAARPPPAAATAPAVATPPTPGVPGVAVQVRAPSFEGGVPSAVKGIGDVAMPLAADLSEARSITLASLLATVASEGLDIRLAQEDVASAEAQRRVVRDSLLPNLSAQTKFVVQNGATQGTAGVFFDTHYQNTAVGPKAELVYDLDTALFTLQAAEEQLGAEQEALRASGHDSLRTAATDYFDLVEACAQLWIAESSVRHAHELVDLELTRVSTGAGLEVDLLRAQAKLAESERAVLEARRQVSVSSAKLVQELGLPPASELVPAETAIVAVELIPLVDLDGLIRRAAQNRPEVAEASRTLAAAREQEGYWENRWLIPQVKLSAEYNGFGPNYQDLADREIYTAGAEWSLEPGNLSQLDKARSARRKAEVAETQITRQVASEVVQAFRSAQAASGSMLSAVREVQADAEFYDLTQVRYREGAAVQEEVLRAELDLTKAQSALTDSLASYDRSQFELARAIGGPAGRASR